MKLYLVISLALWQTSNGKYVNEEYEPEEIQDQVFEVSFFISIMLPLQNPHRTISNMHQNSIFKP